MTCLINICKYNFFLHFSEDTTVYRSRVLIVYDISDEKSIVDIKNIAGWLMKNKFRVEYENEKHDFIRENRNVWMKKVYEEVGYFFILNSSKRA